MYTPPFSILFLPILTQCLFILTNNYQHISLILNSMMLNNDISKIYSYMKQRKVYNASCGLDLLVTSPSPLTGPAAVQLLGQL